MVEVGRGGTEQARFERDVIWDTMLHGSRSCSSATPSLSSGASTARTSPTPLLHRAHRGQRRAPGAGHRRLAGPGGRALLPGHRPPAHGPARRRHFATRGRPLLGVEDELFGDAAASLGLDPATARTASGSGITGHGALIERPGDGPRRASSATSSPPSRASRTRSSAPRCPACWWCRAARAPARRWWRCTAPRTSSTPTGSRSRARACWWSGPTACSSATSSRCCRRWARPASSWRCWPT